MTGAIVAYNPCSSCECKDKCEMCELELFRSRVLKDSKAQEVLSNLKREIHDKAVYPETRSVKPYISLKVVDAIINNKMEEMRHEK